MITTALGAPEQNFARVSHLPERLAFLALYLCLYVFIHAVELVIDGDVIGHCFCGQHDLHTLSRFSRSSGRLYRRPDS